MKVLAVASVVVCTIACWSPRVPPLRDFGPATRVVVTGGRGSDTLAVLQAPADSVRIAALVAFANARNNRWQQPGYGIPVPQVTAFFYGAEFQGSFGVGPDFFETQRAGTFASRSASPEEVAAFAGLLGVSTAVATGHRR